MIYEHAYEIILDDVFLHLTGVAEHLDLYLKVEGLNPAGSIKLKTALNMVTDAEQRGILRPGGRLVESSSGSLGVALAQVSAEKGYRFLCVTDPNTSAQCVAVMRALGADVVGVDRLDASGGYLGSRISYIEQLLTEDPDLVWLNQYANPANWFVHDQCTAAAITAQFPDLDFLFVGAGTSGTLMGCVSHFRTASPGTRIVAVDAVGSVNFGFPAGPRYIPGIGASRRPEIFRPEVVDDLVLVSEPDTVRTCRWLARQHGLFVGGSTGSVVSAILQRAPDLPAGSRVVGISPDLGDRYVRTIYDDAWVTERFGEACLVPVTDDQPALSPLRS
ncbi:2,3-diaminopropionate biosynthesis protein SbnA [Solwaraspora sp. WMMD1047]|uniref:2,3-diaminopropionate biosynthesis protein SbnA n=1 Tax=Solwaraspora sp. WMMD1047 TaxID=3016102 RepID=UPI002416FBD1|nr:2,3-diaminopropionate biosynthesis protein SbnA [Solwaraspora sp. WMMD1047]MDG4830669.1 2,3-diaminopropionate biosynthesis protein SbnA [Solwaraspora sp. WMMD1047]